MFPVFQGIPHLRISVIPVANHHRLCGRLVLAGLPETTVNNGAIGSELDVEVVTDLMSP